MCSRSWRVCSTTSWRSRICRLDSQIEICGRKTRCEPRCINVIGVGNDGKRGPHGEMRQTRDEEYLSRAGLSGCGTKPRTPGHLRSTKGPRHQFQEPVGQRIHIGSDIEITVVRIQNGKVRIGIDAPESVTVMRNELLSEKVICALTEYHESAKIPSAE